MVAETTRLLIALRDRDAAGRDAASTRLLDVVYEELRALAGSFFRNQAADHTLQPTALVHEAWMRLADASSLDIRDRSHFMAVAARAMRQILIDHARASKAVKRGGGAEVFTIDSSLDPVGGDDPADLVALDDALLRLARADERQGQVVEMRVFGGMTVDEVAAALDVSPRTVELDWRMARAWLSRELERA